MPGETPPANRWCVWTVQPQNTARTELHSMITFHHANTRGTLSSTCHVSFLAAPDTDHKHKISLTYLIYLSDDLTITKSVEIKVIDTEAIEPEDLQPRKIDFDRNLGTDPYQIQERLLRGNFQNPITEDMDEFGKVGAQMSYIQSQIPSDYDSAESIADSGLEEGELRKMLASPLYMQSRKDCK